MEEYSKIYQEAIEVLDIWYDKQYDEAINLWGNLYSKHSEAFLGYQPLNNFIKDRQKESIEHNYFKKDLDYLVSSYENEDLEPQLVYTCYIKLLFQIGLNPQHWIDYSELDKSLLRWKSQSGGKDKAFIPYASFMLGLVYGYQGRFSESLEALEKARDGMTSAKQQAAKIEPLISLVKSILGNTVRPQKKSIYSEQNWLDAGFTEKEIETWKYAKIEPSVALQWKENNFSAKDASRWYKADFSLELAKIWAEFFPPQDAIQCRIAGFKEAEDAARWMKIFNFPSEAMRWIEQGFSSQQAAVWIRQSVTDPLEAKKRKEAMH